jgi:hypothetical protein
VCQPGFIKPSGTVSAEKAKQLADELSALSKQQSNALQTAAYISMSTEEAKAYDRRRARISEIWVLLAKFKPEQHEVESRQDTEMKGTSDESEREQTR